MNKKMPVGVTLMFSLIFSLSSYSQTHFVETMHDYKKPLQLTGRRSVHLPAPKHSGDTGRVVLNIWVDKTGSVINAIVDSLHSTTYNNGALKESLKAAYRAKFNTVEIDTIQAGHITYVFAID